MTSIKGVYASRLMSMNNCSLSSSCISSLVPSRQLAPALISHLLQVVKSRKKPPKWTSCLLGQ
ncbi:hypothetical protein AAG906_009315 [Vitis piasezkii]